MCSVDVEILMGVRARLVEAWTVTDKCVHACMLTVFLFLQVLYVPGDGVTAFVGVGDLFDGKLCTLGDLSGGSTISRSMDRFRQPARFKRPLSHIHEACRVSKTMIQEREGESVPHKKLRVDCAVQAMWGRVGTRHSVVYLTITFSDLAQTEGRLC